MPATTSPGSGPPAPVNRRRESFVTTTRHAEQRFVGYTPMQMYDLVADIARYPEFLPWCHAARIGKREGEIAIAELAIGLGPFHERFVSRVAFAPDAAGGPRIETTGVEGPFRLLTSRWTFMPQDGGTLIDFELAFDFRSRLLRHTVSMLFAEAVRRMVSAFEARAERLYGKTTPRPVSLASSAR